MIQLILHLIGDYVTQSDWMANEKTKTWWPAWFHASVYAIPFWLIASPKAWLVIWLSHVLIDRFRLARYVVWAKNWIAPWHMETMTQALDRAKKEGRVTSDSVFGEGELAAFLADYMIDPRRIHPTPPWKECTATGYPPERPAWLAVWLLIAADNTIHLAINYASIKWL